MSGNPCLSICVCVWPCIYIYVRTSCAYNAKESLWKWGHIAATHNEMYCFSTQTQTLRFNSTLIWTCLYSVTLLDL